MISYKQIGLIVFVVLVVLTGFAFYFYQGSIQSFLSQSKNSTTGTSATNNTTTTQILSGTYSTLDSDNDGLKNWEEALWNTDPKNPDTNNDGISDGEEVREGKNPLTGKQLTKLSTSTTTASTASTAPLTYTDQIGRDLFTQFMNLQQSGVTIDSDSADAIAANEVQSQLQKLLAPAYTVNNVPHQIITDKAGITAYGNALGKAIYDNSPRNIQSNEMELFSQFTQSGDPYFGKQLATIALGYQNILNTSLKITVPQEIIGTHLSLLNAYKSLAACIRLMSEFKNDQFGAALGFSAYQTAIQDMVSAFESLNNYFLKNGVTYSVYDSGYVITNAI